MDKNYRKTRLNITILYFAIIFVIVLIFSTIVVVNQNRELSSFERFRDEANINPNRINRMGLPVPLPTARIIEIEDTINDIKVHTIINISLIDIIILIVAAWLSYDLAGLTLKPIIQALEKQKRFVSDASHELRTPLTAMKTEAEVLQRAPKMKISDYSEFTQSVIEEVDQLNRLVESLLDIARSDQDQRTVKLAPIDLQETVNRAVDNFRELAKLKNIDLKLAVPSNIKIQSDADRLQQLVKIILDNALKYTSENGQVAITASKSNEQVTLAIEDNGVGIPPEHLDKIFDRFYRVSSDRNDPGFGLGLAIAKQICDELEATIRITSKPNDGTKVEILFKS